MKFFQKILMIVIIGTLARNVCVDGMLPVGGGGAPPPVLDLPGGVNGTPELQNAGVAGPHNGIQCIHVKINLGVNACNTLIDEATNAGININDAIKVAMRNAPAALNAVAVNGEQVDAELAGVLNAPGIPVAVRNAGIIRKVATKTGNIYFPANGSQPTTPEAVEYSCANIDNRENSPITEWYMMMFGVIPAVPGGGGGAPAVFVQAGWNNAAPPAAQRIISFHANFNDGDIIKDPDSGELLSREDFFKRNLRRIASTSVGRVLLYRILIEIRRHNPGGNVGVLDNTVPVHANVFFRNACRSIFIQWNNRAEFTFDAGNRWICIINTGTTLPSLGKEGVDPPRSYDNVILCKLPVDVSMFHEMNHWYHYLRYPDRYYNEKNYYQIGLHIDGTNMPVNLGLPLPVGAPPVAAILGRYYWGILGGWGNMVGSERLWYYSARNAAATESRPDFEEMRNILGIKNIGLPVGLVFYNGDDLSENLYRMSVGQPLRFGYVLAEYYEDSRVIDVIISICNFWKEHYNFSPRRMKRANFEYTNASNQQGMGSCKTFQ